MAGKGGWLLRVRSKEPLIFFSAEISGVHLLQAAQLTCRRHRLFFSEHSYLPQMLPVNFSRSHAEQGDHTSSVHSWNLSFTCVQTRPCCLLPTSEWPQSNTDDHASLPDSRNLSDEMVEAHDKY